MRNRRNVIIAFLVVAVLCLGVGFAALSDSLTVGGTLSYNPDKGNEALNAAVYFTDGEVTGGTCTKSASITVTVDNVDASNTKDKLTITVGEDAFAVAGETAIITATIKNDSETAVTVSAHTETAYATHFTILSPSADIEANGTGTITITITLKTVPAATISAEAFSFDITAEPTT